MTVKQAIASLQNIEKKHGSDVPVYFDCPHCNQSFTPGVLETKAVHLQTAPNAPEPTGKSR